MLTLQVPALTPHQYVALIKDFYGEKSNPFKTLDPQPQILETRSLKHKTLNP